MMSDESSEGMNVMEGPNSLYYSLSSGTRIHVITLLCK